MGWYNCTLILKGFKSWKENLITSHHLFFVILRQMPIIVKRYGNHKSFAQKHIMCGMNSMLSKYKTYDTNEYTAFHFLNNQSFTYVNVCVNFDFQDSLEHSKLIRNT